MDNEIILRQFDDVEKKVEKLVEINKDLEATNSELNNKILTLEQELQEKTASVSNFSEQKALIRSRVDSLLSKLNNFTQD